jgi:hypothetical protein
MAKLLVTNGLFVKLHRENAGPPCDRVRPELPMFSLLSGALLPINAPDNPVFDEFQKAAPQAASGPR